MNSNQIILKIKSCKSYEDCVSLTSELHNLGWQVNLKLGIESIWKGYSQKGGDYFEFVLDRFSLKWHYSIKGLSGFSTII